MHVPGSNLGGHPAGMIEIPALYISGQAVRGIVSDSNRLFFGVIGNHHQYRTKYFLLRNGHVVADIRKHRGAHVVAAVNPIWKSRSATHNLGPLRYSRLDKALNLIPLNLRNDRTHGGGLRRRWPHHYTLGHLGRYLLGLRKQTARDQHPRGRVTGLPCIVVHVHHTARHRSLEIRIVEDNIG